MGRCDSCGNPACLSCAIPVRGKLLCQTCASRELGAPEPPASITRRPRRPDVAAAVLLGVALLATIPPWHRSGPLTEVLSAWRPGPQPWPLIASLGALVALAAALAPVATRRISARAGAAACALVASLAGVAAALALAASPDYTSPTLAPFAVLAAAGSAAILGFASSRRARP